MIQKNVFFKFPFLSHGNYIQSTFIYKYSDFVKKTTMLEEINIDYDYEDEVYNYFLCFYKF